jgi:hypothetical protein
MEDATGNIWETRQTCLMLAITNTNNGTSWDDILKVAKRFERFVVDGDITHPEGEG